MREGSFPHMGAHVDLSNKSLLGSQASGRPLSRLVRESKQNRAGVEKGVLPYNTKTLRWPEAGL